MKSLELLSKLNFIKVSRLHINLTLSIILLLSFILFLSSDISLPIFYQNGLAHSVFAPILIGTLIMTFGAEIFGWTFSGLIVPGFLAPIVLIEPFTAGTMIFEAIVSYYCVLGLSNLGIKLDLWSEFFGRERFFAILLVSTGVRLLIEGYIVAILGRLFIEQYKSDFDYQNSLYSIGFIVVPLLANMFWNTGMRRALFPVTVSIILTCLITYYVLVAHTNFSIGYFWLIFEKPSLGFTSNPKAHIILLTTAFIASHTNLKYGWDFNGIMVPALLALIWPTPSKLLFTFLEAFLILFVAKFIATRKRFETTTLEGPRKTALLFSISFFLKMFIDAVTNLSQTGLNAIDFYGYGYLLPTLLAGKMWQKRSINNVLIPTLRVSLLGAIVGHLIGFSLTLISPVTTTKLNFTDELNKKPPISNNVISTDQNIYATTLFSRNRIKTATPNNPVKPIEFREYERFNTAFDMISSDQNLSNKTTIQSVNLPTLLKDIHYETLFFTNNDQQITDILLRETPALGNKTELNGWGLFLFSLNSSSNLVITVPLPILEKDSLEIAILMYKKLNAKALIVAGAYKQKGRNLSKESILPEKSPFNLATKKYASQGSTILEIRSSTKEPQLIVYNELSNKLDLHKVKEITGEFNLLLNQTPSSRAQQTNTSYLELWLNSNLTSTILAQNLPIKSYSKTDVVEENFFYEWLKNNNILLPRVSQDKVIAPTKDELTFFVEQLLTPLFTNIKETTMSELKRLELMSSLIGYRAILFSFKGNNQQYLILTEQDPPTRYWETIIVKLDNAAPLIVEVPNAVSEKKGLDFALHNFQALNAKMMLIGGTSFVRTENEKNPITSEIFNISHQRAQVLLSLNQIQPPLVLQFRSTEMLAEEIGADIIISTGNEVIDKDQLSVPAQLIVNKLTKNGYKVAFYDGSKERVSFSIKNNLQKNFSDLYFPKTFLSIWIAPKMPSAPRINQETSLTKTHVLALKLESQEGSLLNWLTQQTFPKVDSTITENNIETLINLTKRYHELHNINDLKLFIKEAQNQKYQPIYFEDKVTNSGFLILKRNSDILHIFRITSLSNEQSQVSSSNQQFRQNLTNFINGNQIWLKILP